MKGFIAQAYKGHTDWWRYLIPCILFFGLMGLNILVAIVLDIDQSQIIADQIEKDGKNYTTFVNLIPFAFLLGLLFIYVKFGHKLPILSLTTSRKKFDWNRFFFIFIITTLLLTAYTLGDFYFNPDSYELSFNLEKFSILFLILIILIPVQAGFEEYFFRGYLMQGIGVISKNRAVALLATSLVFGLLHISNPEVSALGPLIMISYIGTGLLFGIMTLMDDGMELALGYHIANNLTIGLLVTANWTAFQTESILIYKDTPKLSYDVLIPVFVIYPIILFILAKKYKWKNWKNRLFGKVQKPEFLES